MAVQARFGGLAGGCQLLPYGGGGGGLGEEQLQALLSVAGGNNTTTNYNKLAQQYHHCAAGVASAAQSELTCNGGGFGGAVASRKRGRDGGDLEPQFHHHHHVPMPSSSAALLPIPGVVTAAGNVRSGRMAADSAAAASTSGRPPSTAADALLGTAAAAEQWQAEVDAVVRAGCERLRAGLERARKRQCEAVALAAARALRATEAELGAARRRAAELEELLRLAAAEAQAWCGLARSNEAAASGLRATLDALLLRAGGGGVACAAAQPAAIAGVVDEEGFGESAGVADDAESCCFVEAADGDAAAADSRAKWACRACGGGEASVLLLPCRHLCLCKACEPRFSACPVCSGDKNAAIHIAPN